MPDDNELWSYWRNMLAARLEDVDDWTIDVLKSGSLVVVSMNGERVAQVESQDGAEREIRWFWSGGEGDWDAAADFLANEIKESIQ